MPRGASAGLERDRVAGCARWCVCLEERVDADSSGKPLCRPFAGGLRTASLYLQRPSPSRLASQVARVIVDDTHDLAPIGTRYFRVSISPIPRRRLHRARRCLTEAKNRSARHLPLPLRPLPSTIALMRIARWVMDRRSFLAYTALTALGTREALGQHAQHGAQAPLPEAAPSPDPFARLQGGVPHHLAPDQEAQRVTTALLRQASGALDPSRRTPYSSQ